MDKNLPNGFKKIYLSGKKGNGLYATVSSDDYENVKRHKWYFGPGGYAVTRDHVYMHRFITGAQPGEQVDHKNHNRLDNRRSNLRVCTVKENQQNRKLKRYRWCERLNRWEVRLKKDGKWTKRYFRTEAEALSAVKKIKSGIIPDKSICERNRYLPKYISRYFTKSGALKYYFRCRINGKICTKGGFSTIKEAKIFRDSFFSNMV